MKMIPAFVILLLASFSPAEEGTWGGKWDDKWTVFVTIEKDPKVEGGYAITYRHFEHEGGTMSVDCFAGKGQGEAIIADPLLIKTSGKSGLLYGDFSTPRMANLVKIDPAPSEFLDVDLKKYGWKTGAIPAAQAQMRIMGAGKQPVEGK
jgi:hypothetical protein